jgi:multiple antibiotic resistance protein
MSQFIEQFLTAFFSIFVIMDVLGNIPIFCGLAEKLKKEDRKKSVDKALTVASILLLVFLFFGNSILTFFGVTIDSFKVAGGIILLIIGIEMVLHFKLSEKRAEKYEFAIIPLATPLITGPGVITTIILLTQSVGLWITFLASALNLFITWLVLRFSDIVYKFLGRQGSEVMSRIMGLILAALAIKFIKSGWMGM